MATRRARELANEAPPPLMPATNTGAGQHPAASDRRPPIHLVAEECSSVHRLRTAGQSEPRGQCDWMTVASERKNSRRMPDRQSDSVFATSHIDVRKY